MVDPPLWLPPKCLWLSGMPGSRIPLSVMPSWIVSFTTPTGWICVESHVARSTLPCLCRPLEGIIFMLASLRSDGWTASPELVDDFTGICSHFALLWLRSFLNSWIYLSKSFIIHYLTDRRIWLVTAMVRRNCLRDRGCPCYRYCAGQGFESPEGLVLSQLPDPKNCSLFPSLFALRVSALASIARLLGTDKTRTPYTSRIPIAYEDSLNPPSPQQTAPPAPPAPPAAG